MNILIGLFIALHGLVHILYIAISQKWIPDSEPIGWTGRSWLFTPLAGENATRWILSGLYGLATLVLVIGGAGYALGGSWAPGFVAAGAILSIAAIVLGWDGNPQRLVNKGLLGIAISAAILLLVR